MFVVDVALPASPAAVTEVRAQIAVRLAGTACANDVVLVTSELLANAALHAGGPCHVSVAQHQHCVRVEVTDLAPGLPVMGLPLHDNDGGSGRGLRIVEALSDRWGVQPRADGSKTVWAEVGPGDASAPTPERDRE